MDLYNYNGNNKRKFSNSIEQEENLKRKNIKNDESISCFRRCCNRKKHEIKSVNKEKIQSVSIEKVSNVPMTHLKRSPLYNETTFCRKVSESYDDPCIECTVQDGPDIWENIPKNSNKQLYDNNKPLSMERSDVFMNKIISHDDFGSSSAKEKSTKEALNSLENTVNSFINNIIGDGVDRISEINTTVSTHRNRQKELKIHNKSSTNFGNNFQENKLKENSSDFEKPNQNLDFTKQQYQYPGLVFEKQNLKNTSQISHPSSINRSLDNASSQIISDDYNWNLASKKTNFDQQKILDKRNSSEEQEPYNWDYQEYQWSSPLDSSQKNQSIINNQSKQSVINDKDIFLSDNDSTDPSYSIASVLPPNKRRKAQSPSNDLKNSTPSLDVLNQQQKSLLNLSEDKDLVPTINSTHSSKFNHDKLQASDINSKNNTSLSQNPPNPSSEILPEHETREHNNQLSTTSVSDLFTHAKKQKSLDLDSMSTAHSIPISLRPSVLPEVVTDKDDKNHAQSSRTTLTKNYLPVSSNTETNQMKNMDAKDQTRLLNRNLSTKCTQSHPTDTQESQSSSTGINNTFDQIRSTYDDIMSSWRHLLERFLSFMLPSTHDTDRNINLSPSIITSNIHSWSTMLPTETLNLAQSDNIGPWWGRRNAYDRTPATFIFANESLSAWYSIGTITSNKQMCISTENRPCCFKYNSYPNTCHCYCSSSITINNSSSTS